MKRLKHLKYFALFATILFISCEKEEEYENPPPCEPNYSDRPNSQELPEQLGLIKQMSGYYVIYNSSNLTHYYACNLPTRWKSSGEEVYFSGNVKTNISHFEDDPNSQTGGQVAVIDMGPCETIEQDAGVGCNCKLLELTEIKPEYYSSPIW